jgi:hypothetical protein
LEGYLRWFYQFRQFWPDGNTCKLYRIRRVWPTFTEWYDYYWYFSKHTGRILTPADLYCVKVRIAWWTGRVDIRNSCTYVNQLTNAPFEKNLLVGNSLALIEDWANLHDTLHTTAFGDTFRPCILDMSGNYSTVLGHWVDRRAVASRVHRWRG